MDWLFLILLIAHAIFITSGVKNPKTKTIDTKFEMNNEWKSSFLSISPSEVQFVDSCVFLFVEVKILSVVLCIF